MKRQDKAYVSAWVMLLVFVPMVLLSSLHVHPELAGDDGAPCHECIDHTVHNGHLKAVKATVDCPLCAFGASVYQGEREAEVTHYEQLAVRIGNACATPSVIVSATDTKCCRAPPTTFCAS